MSGANPWRGEASLTVAGIPCVLRPSFAALVGKLDYLSAAEVETRRAREGAEPVDRQIVEVWRAATAGAQLHSQP